MISSCNHLSELLKIQESIIRKNVDTHKYLRHISTTEAGVIDFIESYGWLLREVYCGHVCSTRNDCEIAKDYIPKEI
jgi:hypothetical protein